MRDLVCSSLPKIYRNVDRSSIRIILVEAGPRIVAEMHHKLGAYVMSYLEDSGIEVRLQSRITRIWKTGVGIDNSEYIPAGTVIWVSGVAVSPLVADLDVAKDDMGRLMVNEYLELPDAPGVYVAGDCAHIHNPKSQRPVTPTAHTAVRQARVVACNILADIRGLKKKTYRYSKPPDLVSLGTYKAVFHWRFLRLHGMLPRLILMGSYLFLITGTSNRISIVIDWLLSLFFGRDTTFLGQKQTPDRDRDIASASPPIE